MSQRILGLFAAAIIDKGTIIGIRALGSHFDFGFAAVEHFSVTLHPLRDCAAQFPHLLRDVLIVEQAPVIAVAGIHELIVDVTKIDRFDRDTRGFQDPGLHGTICVMMIFDRGAGFYFDEFIALAARLEDIYADQNIMRFEGRFEDRCAGLFFKQTPGVLYGSICSVIVGDEYSVRILGTSYIVDVIARSKALLNIGTVFNAPLATDAFHTGDPT